MVLRADRRIEAWSVYRDMGPSRTLEKVAQKLGKNRSLIHRWSAQDHWMLKISEHEEALAMQAAVEQRKSLLNRQKQMREVRLGLADEMMVRVREEFLRRDPAKMPASVLLRFYELCFAVQRKDLGEPDDQLENALLRSEQAQTPLLDLTRLSNDEFDEYRRLLAKMEPAGPAEPARLGAAHDERAAGGGGGQAPPRDLRQAGLESG